MQPTPTHLDFLRALEAAEPGDFLIYHTGYLLKDRSFKRANHDDAKRIDKLATVAWAEFIAGKCLLVQRRLGDKKYEYIAIKRRFTAPVSWFTPLAQERPCPPKSPSPAPTPSVATPHGIGGTRMTSSTVPTRTSVALSTRC